MRSLSPRRICRAADTSAGIIRPLGSGRRGLAPLELVLSLPILLMVMGLMILIGTAGGWKLRTQATSRQAAWRMLTLRTGENDGLPQGVPSNAEMQYTDPGKPLFPSDPYAGFAVVRGPTLGSGGGGGGGQGLPVNQQLMDISQGVRQGHARVRRGFPLLGRLPPREFDFTVEHVLVDGTKWSYWSMGFGSNVERRILRTYDFQLQAHAPQEIQRYTQAAFAIIQNPRKEDLTPLEGDDPEILQMFGERSPDFARNFSINVEWRGFYDPRSYPAALQFPPSRVVSGSAPSYCQTNPDIVRQDKVEPYKRSIQHRTPPSIPLAMSRYYISQYQRRQGQLQAMIPPPPGVAPPGVQQEIDDLQAKIDQLNKFISQLPL